MPGAIPSNFPHSSLNKASCILAPLALVTVQDGLKSISKMIANLEWNILPLHLTIIKVLTAALFSAQNRMNQSTAPFFGTAS